MLNREEKAALDQVIERIRQTNLELIKALGDSLEPRDKELYARYNTIQKEIIAIENHRRTLDSLFVERLERIERHTIIGISKHLIRKVQKWLRRNQSSNRATSSASAAPTVSL